MFNIFENQIIIKTFPEQKIKYFQLSQQNIN